MTWPTANATARSGRSAASVSTRAREQFAGGPFWLFLLVVASCLETVTVAVGPATLRPVQFVAGLLILVHASRRIGPTSTMVRSASSTIALIALLAIVPFLAHPDALRILQPGLLATNVLLMAVAFVTYRASDPKKANLAIGIGLFAVTLVPFVQFVLVAAGALPIFADGRLYGLGRESGTFEEANWSGIVAGFAFFWGATFGSGGLAAESLLVAILSASRTVWASLIVAGARLVLPGLSRTALAGVGFSVLVLATVAFTPVTSAFLTPTYDVTTLDSRLLDQSFALSRLTPEEWIVGSGQLDLYDYSRSRQLPVTMNNAYTDFVWKQGVFGLGTLAVVMVSFLASWPRAAKIRVPPWRANPVVLFISSIVLFSFANSALLRPWLYVLAGLAYAASVPGDREVRAVQIADLPPLLPPEPQGRRARRLPVENGP